MEPLQMLWIFLIGVIIGMITSLILVYRFLVNPLRDELDKVMHDKRSLSTVYGRITEQFAPFMKSYPFSPDNFRFIGSPVDGIQFEDDRIIFVEFKTNRSKLSKDQRRIKELVRKKKVDWFEFIIR